MNASGVLAEMGFDAKWGVLGIPDTIDIETTPKVTHDRYRIWIAGKSTNNNSLRKLQQERSEQDEWGRIGDLCQKSSNTNRQRQQGIIAKIPNQKKRKEQRKRQAGSQNHGNRWWETEPSVGRVVDGMANRSDRLKAIGNGQVPAVAAMAWEILSK